MPSSPFPRAAAGLGRVCLGIRAGVTTATASADRAQTGAEPFEQLSDAVKGYVVAKGGELISRVGGTVREVTERVAERVPDEVGATGQAGIAGVRALAEGESPVKALWAALTAGAKARLRAMFGPDVGSGQKALNALKVALVVLIALVAVLLAAVLLPVVIVVLVAAR